MTNAVITWLEAELAKAKAAIEPAETAVVDDAEAIGSSALTYIKTNGLTALYKIAESALVGAIAGAPWATTMATVVTQGEAAGITIAKGAEAVVLAQAQADLIAAGTLLPPVAATPGVEPAAAS